MIIKPAESKLELIKAEYLQTEKRHHHGCFPGNFAIFFETSSMERQSIFFSLSVLSDSFSLKNQTRL